MSLWIFVFIKTREAVHHAAALSIQNIAGAQTQCVTEEIQ